MLRHSFRLQQEASAVEMAVSHVLAEGHRTRDLAKPCQPVITTSEMGSKVAEAVRVEVGVEIRH